MPEVVVWGPHSLEAPGAPEALVDPWEPCGWYFGSCWLTVSRLKTVQCSPARLFIYLRSNWISGAAAEWLALLGRGVAAGLWESGLGTGRRRPHTLDL